MKLKNVLIVVEDTERSKKFYEELFGLSPVLDRDGNVILTEGLVLQERKIWEQLLGKTAVRESNSFELYFEESDLKAFSEKLERLYPSVRYAGSGKAEEQGNLRFYDPDGNLIEVGSAGHN